MNSKSFKIYIVAGEASGDIHASGIIRAVKHKNKSTLFRFFGGDLMQKESETLVKHYKELAFMGLWEVVKNIRKIKNNLDFCKNDILNFKPDALILVDYPGFNLKIAKFAKKNGIKVYYYISPKVWVWKKSRINIIKKYIDKMFVIFPFEVDFYKKYNFDVLYFGNPTKEAVKEELSIIKNKNLFIEENKFDNRPIVALLPGSRIQEVKKMLPLMLKVSEKFPNYQFVVAGLSSVDKNIYQNNLKNTKIRIIFDKTFELLRFSFAAVVTSGTATLETALFNVPQVVCYKTSGLSYSVGKMIVKIDYFSLVNILSKKMVVKEFLQNKLEDSISNELELLLNDEIYREKMKNDYQKLSEMLGDCSVSEKIAEFILNEVQ